MTQYQQLPFRGADDDITDADWNIIANDFDYFDDNLSGTPFSGIDDGDLIRRTSGGVEGVDLGVSGTPVGDVVVQLTDGTALGRLVGGDVGAVSLASLASDDSASRLFFFIYG